MADTSNQPSTQAAESQAQRWVKYGLNVTIATVAVVAIGVILIYVAQQSTARADLATRGVRGLRPQTTNIIDGLKQDVKLVSLYYHPTADDVRRDEDAARAEGRPPTARTVLQQAEAVDDLLAEYDRASDRVTAESIDPTANRAKVDQLIEEITARYSEDVAKYTGLIDEYRKQLDEIGARTAAELQQMTALGQGGGGQALDLIRGTIDDMARQLQRQRDDVERTLKQRPPDYRSAASQIQAGMSNFAALAGAVVQEFRAPQAGAGQLPADVQAYIAAAAPRFEELKKLADGVVERSNALGETKIDALGESLKQPDALLVLGDKELRVISRSQVWPRDAELRAMVGKDLGPQFAGEQQVTAALLSLDNPAKQKVAFVRAGGPPLTSPGVFPFQPPGELSRVAQRLRDYNFDVLEKDATGQWQQQAMMRGMPAGPEPTDEELKDAIWVAIVSPPPGGSPFAPPTGLGEKVGEHLKAGGSALIVYWPEGERVPALADWGIDVRPDTLVVHERIEQPDGELSSFMDLLREPLFFPLRNYGDHPLARPVNGLQGLLAFSTVVTTAPKDGYTVTPLVPVPEFTRVWGETNVQDLRQGKAVYDEGVDVKGPLFAGAAAEKADGGSRLVVLGTPAFAMNRIVTLSDPDMAQRGVAVARFPGNAEVFANAVLWLAKQETMMALSANAMEVSRVGYMSDRVRNVWHGLVVAGLPALVIAAGVVTFVARRS